MGAQNGKTKLEWPKDVSVDTEAENAAFEYFKKEGKEKVGMSYKEFARWFAVPPPCVVGGGRAKGVQWWWRGRCIGLSNEPSDQTAPGLQNLRWYIPGPSSEWKKLYDSETSGLNKSNLLSTVGLYPAHTVIVLNLPIGTLGALVVSWPSICNPKWKPGSVPFVFSASGRKLVIQHLTNPTAVPSDLNLGPLQIASNMQSCAILEHHPDYDCSVPLSHDPEVHVQSIAVYGVGTAGHYETFQRRIGSRDASVDSSRKVDRAAVMGHEVDRYILETAGIVGEKHDPSHDRV